jgi:pimeloyl-ACP methyl ester carboxylesterase
MSTDATDAVPEWFQRAIDDRPDHLDISVNGDRVHYRAWGDADDPGIVLLHGGGAHSGWWDHVAPTLAQTHRVVAPDLTGHGDSARKATYPRMAWCDEVAAVIAAESFERPVLIGHSMGGWIAIFTGVQHPTVMSSLIVLDSPLGGPPPEESALRKRLEPTRVYPNKVAALARFRTVPEQPGSLPYVIDHVANESLREVEGGWTWKFDPMVFSDRSPHRDLLLELTVPATLVRSEHGLVSPEMAATLSNQHPLGMPVVELANAGHHAMLDQPLALVALLNTLLDRS